MLSSNSFLRISAAFLVPACDVANATSYSGTLFPIVSFPASIIASATFPADLAILSSSSVLIILIESKVGVMLLRNLSSVKDDI